MEPITNIRAPQVAPANFFNTGTVSWVYRCVVEGLFGLKGNAEGLQIAPQLPSHWQHAKAEREFRGAHFTVAIERHAGLVATQIYVDGALLEGNVIAGIETGRRYHLRVLLHD